jgi:molecular chaperone Hsp33
MSDKDNDYLYRFVFEEFGVRGEFVRLAASWQAVREKHDYPEPVARALGSALAAVSLLSATIKFKGSLVLQVQGDGLVRSLVAQATEQGTLRGMASFGPPPEGQDLETDQVLGHARLVLTAEAPNGERYQGIVPVEGGGVVGAVEHYFSQSEQLPTRLWLATGGERVGGLFLQRLPGMASDADDWNRVITLADTITDAELLSLDVEELLYRLFHEESVRLFEPEPLAFRCGCSRERVGQALVAIGEGEVAQILDEMGAIEVNCEFCNASYRFDAVDAAALFTQPPADAPESVQ